MGLIKLCCDCIISTLPSLHLVLMIFGTAIPTSFYIFDLFVDFLVYRSILKADVTSESLRYVSKFS